MRYVAATCSVPLLNLHQQEGMRPEAFRVELGLASHLNLVQSDSLYAWFLRLVHGRNYSRHDGLQVWRTHSADWESFLAKDDLCVWRWETDLLLRMPGLENLPGFCQRLHYPHLQGTESEWVELGGHLTQVSPLPYDHDASQLITATRVPHLSHPQMIDSFDLPRTNRSVTSRCLHNPMTSSMPPSRPRRPPSPRPSRSFFGKPSRTKHHRRPQAPLHYRPQYQ